MENLPLEVIYEILYYLDYDSIENFCYTCKKYKSILNDNLFWHNLAKLLFNDWYHITNRRTFLDRYIMNNFTVKLRNILSPQQFLKSVLHYKKYDILRCLYNRDPFLVGFIISGHIYVHSDINYGKLADNYIKLLETREIK